MAYRRTPAIQARMDEQREALVGAAITLLAEQGYVGCSILAVAGRAGVAAGTVYRHFDSKSALAAEVFRTVVGGEVGAVRAAVASEPDPAGRVRAVIETFAGRAWKSPRLAYALLAEPVGPVVDELRAQFRVAFRAILAEIVSEGVRDATFAPQDPAVVAAALVGAIAEALVRPLVTGADQPETVESLVQFAYRALGAVDAAHA